MKTIFIVAAILLTGCGPGMDASKVRAQVSEDFKGCDISPLPGASWKFIVRTRDGSVRLVEYMATDLSITANAELIPARRIVE